jgi:hypothetical protein
MLDEEAHDKVMSTDFIITWELVLCITQKEVSKSTVRRKCPGGLCRASHI